MGFVLGAMNAMGGEEAILDVISNRLEDSPYDGTRIRSHKRSTLLRYIRTLCFLPLFNRERPIELDSYEGRTLGAITSADGEHVRYRTTDRFLRELTSLGVGDDMSRSLAGRYCQTFYDVEEMPLYVDGHFKAVWTVKNVPKGKHGMMDRIMAGRKLVFLNGHDGHPLLHRTCPGDRHLTKEILPLVEDFEKSAGGEVVNMVVVDGEGCSLEVFKAFDQLNRTRKKKIYPLTVLDSNQYRIGDFKVRCRKGKRPVRDSDFAVFKRDKKGRVKSRVALIEFDYRSNANRRRKNGEQYLTRCALVKKRDGKITVIITTMPTEMIASGAELANLYYNRWPCQEAKFKEMARYCNLRVNHGFGKVRVFNRMAAKRLERAEKSLAYNTRRIKNLRAKREGVKRQIEKRRVRWGEERNKLEGQIERLGERLRDRKGDEGKLSQRLMGRLRELGQLEGRYPAKIEALEEKEKGLGGREKRILKSMEQNREEVDRWKKELEDTPFLEIDPEMDHVMTNLKILYENSLLYAKDTFFEGKIGMRALFRHVINHYGDIEILDDEKTMRFKLNRFDGKGLTKKVRRACRIFNEMKIRTSDGMLLEMVVKG